MDVVRLMGIEKREWVDKATGELKQFVGLHVVYEQGGVESGFVGKRCENFACPREVNPADLKMGQCYELQYTHFQMKNGLGARITGLVPVEVK